MDGTLRVPHDGGQGNHHLEDRAPSFQKLVPLEAGCQTQERQTVHVHHVSRIGLLETRPPMWLLHYQVWRNQPRSHQRLGSLPGQATRWKTREIWSTSHFMWGLVRLTLNNPNQTHSDSLGQWRIRKDEGKKSWLWRNAQERLWTEDLLSLTVTLNGFYGKFFHNKNCSAMFVYLFTNYLNKCTLMS